MTVRKSRHREMALRLSSCDHFVGLSWTSLKFCRPIGCMATEGHPEIQSPFVLKIVYIIINKMRQVLSATEHKIRSQ